MIPLVPSSLPSGATISQESAPDEDRDLFIPSDAELEAHVRERLPAHLRDPRYPRPKWQQAIRWVLRWTWLGFVAYVVGAASTLGSSIINGQSITSNQVIQALLLGRVVPLVRHLPLLALILPIALLALTILVGLWAHRDREREQHVLGKQNEWVREEKQREHARVVAKQEAGQRRHVQWEEEQAQLASEYGVQLVAQLTPQDYLANYVDVYQPRRILKTGADADQLACDTLRAARRATDAGIAQGNTPSEGAVTPVGQETPLGILVIGRPTLGKTRCAWEAMRSVLPDALFVRWPHGDAHPFDYASQQGKTVALWLDDVHTYAATDRDAATLTDLPRRLAKSQLVVVATCRDGQDAEQARTRLDGLIRQLVTIPLADLTHTESEALINQLQRQGVQTFPEEQDGTAGAPLLGVQAMRTQRYPHLPTPAKAVLQAMKLLRSAQIYDYPAERVYVVAHKLFGLEDSPVAWKEAIGALVRDDFVRLGAGTDVEGRRPLEPVADTYLEHAVPDYPTPGAQLTDDWPPLAEALASLMDVYALLSLADACNRSQRFEESVQIAQKAHDAAEKRDDRLGVSHALGMLASIEWAGNRDYGRASYLDFIHLKERMG